MKGTVKFFNDMKGFGFITAEDGNEYFVHQEGLQEGVRLQENDSVSFDVEEGERGPKAVNVSKGDSSEESSDEEDSSEEPSDEEDSKEDSSEDSEE